MTKLEQEVLDIINDTIKGCYIGTLRVNIYYPERQCGDSYCHELNDTVYELRLYLDRWFTPVILSHEGTEREFKNFIREEFKRNRYEWVKYFKITREPIVLEETEWDDE